MRFQSVTLIFLNPNVIFIRSLFCWERNKIRCQIYSVFSFIYFRLENMESWNFRSRNSVYKSRKKKQALTVLIKVLSVLNVVVFLFFIHVCRSYNWWFHHNSSMPRASDTVLACGNNSILVFGSLKCQGEFLAVVCSSSFLMTAIPMQPFFFQFHFKSLLNYNCNLESDFNLSMRFIDFISAEQEYRDVILFMTRSTFTYCHL